MGMKTKYIVIGIAIAMILIAGCAAPLQKCNVDRGNITSKSTIPDTTGWGGTKYTVTLDHNATYEVSRTDFVNANIGNFTCIQMCYNYKSG